MYQVACSKRSDSGERCEIKKAMKSRGRLGREVRELSHLSSSLAFIFFALLFTSHCSPLSERLEQAMYQGLITCHDLSIKNATVDLVIRLKENLKCIF